MKNMKMFILILMVVLLPTLSFCVTVVIRFGYKLEGKATLENINLDDTMGDVRKQFEKIEQAEPGAQPKSFYFKDKKLKDNKTLKYYGIKNNAVIDLK